MPRSNPRSTTRPKCRRSPAPSRCRDSCDFRFSILDFRFPGCRRGKAVTASGASIENQKSKIENPMTPAFEKLQKHLKQLPGLGYRSAERIALHLLVEKPARLPALVEALEEAARSVRRCQRC